MDNRRQMMHSRIFKSLSIGLSKLKTKINPKLDEFIIIRFYLLDL